MDVKNQEVAIEIAGPLRNAIGARKRLLVSIDHHTMGPEAKVLQKPTTEKVIEFLRRHITRPGMPKTKKMDPAAEVRSTNFNQVCKEWLINHVECPIRDHKGNGKIEGLKRTINKMLRTNKEMGRADDSCLSEFLFALRINPSANENIALLTVYGRK